MAVLGLIVVAVSFAAGCGTRTPDPDDPMGPMGPENRRVPPDSGVTVAR